MLASEISPRSSAEAPKKLAPLQLAHPPRLGPAVGQQVRRDVAKYDLPVPDARQGAEGDEAITATYVEQSLPGFEFRLVQHPVPHRALPCLE